MAKIFRLQGESMDLDCLARLFRSGDPVVKKEDEQNYLYLDGWDSASDEVAWGAAEAALTRMNAIASMLYGNHHRVAIAGIAKLDPATNKLRTTLNASTRIEGRTRAYAELIVNDKISATSGEAAFALADANKAVERAFYLYGSVEHDWRGLYMVLDAIKHGHGSLKRLKAAELVSFKKIKDFTGTANSFEALGKDARHGPLKTQIAKAKMTLDEARELIRKMLEQWVAKFNPKK